MENDVLSNSFHPRSEKAIQAIIGESNSILEKSQSRELGLQILIRGLDKIVTKTHSSPFLLAQNNRSTHFQNAGRGETYELLDLKLSNCPTDFLFCLPSM